MRWALILIIFLNVIGALGSAIVSLGATEGQSIISRVGASFDAAVIEASIAIVATAVLRTYPIKTR